MRAEGGSGCQAHLSAHLPTPWGPLPRSQFLRPLGCLWLDHLPNKTASLGPLLKMRSSGGPAALSTTLGPSLMAGWDHRKLWHQADLTLSSSPV